MKGSYHSTYSDRVALAANQYEAEKEFWVKTLGDNLEKSCFPGNKSGFQKGGENRKIDKVTFRFSEEQVDPAFYASETEKDIEFNLLYSTALFKRATIERFVRYFEVITSTVVDNRDIPLKDIVVTHNLQTADSSVYESLENQYDFN